MKTCQGKHWNVGKDNPNFGKKTKGFKGRNHTEESKKKLSQERLAEKNPMWKGDKVGDSWLHQWLHKHIPKTEICECCEEKTPLDLANYTGIYNRDLDNWCWLCRSCHVLLDYRTGDRS